MTQQYFRGLALGHNEQVYIVLEVGTTIYNGVQPREAGPVSLGLWVATSASEAIYQARSMMGYGNQELTAPMLIAFRPEAIEV